VAFDSYERDWVANTEIDTVDRIRKQTSDPIIVEAKRMEAPGARRIGGRVSAGRP